MLVYVDEEEITMVVHKCRYQPEGLSGSRGDSGHGGMVACCSIPLR